MLPFVDTRGQTEVHTSELGLDLVFVSALAQVTLLICYHVF